MSVCQSDGGNASAEPQSVVEFVDRSFLAPLQVFGRGVEVVVLSVVHQQIREFFVVSRSKNCFIFEASEQSCSLLRLEFDGLDCGCLVRLGKPLEEVYSGGCEGLLFELLVAYFEEVVCAAAVGLLGGEVQVDVPNPLAELVQRNLLFLPRDLPDEVFPFFHSFFYCFGTIKSLQSIFLADFRAVLLSDGHVSLFDMHD